MRKLDKHLVSTQTYRTSVTTSKILIKMEQKKRIHKNVLNSLFPSRNICPPVLEILTYQLKQWLCFSHLHFGVTQHRPEEKDSKFEGGIRQGKPENQIILNYY